MNARSEEFLQWLGLTAASVLLIAGSLGCATAAMSSIEPGQSDPKPVLSDRILALGYPDAGLRKEAGQDDLLVLVGREKSYLLHKGGAELDMLSRLKLDSRRIDIAPPGDAPLYLKDDQVWGEVIITYRGAATLSPEEQAELSKGRYVPVPGAVNRFQRRVAVEGTIHPPVRLSDAQLSRLTTVRDIAFYAPGAHKNPPFLRKVSKVPLVALGVAVDTAISPTFGVIGLVFGAASIVDQR